MDQSDIHSLVGMLKSLGSIGIVSTIAIGFAAGVVAKIIMPGRDPGGLLVTTLLGVGGSGLATYVGNRFDLFRAGEIPGFAAAVVGAFLLLLVYRLLHRVLIGRPAAP